MTLLGNAVALVVLAVLLASLPTKFLLPKRFLLKQAVRPRVTPSKTFASALLPFNGTAPSPFLEQPLSVGVGPLGFLLVLQPTAPVSAAVNVSAELVSWHTANKGWFDDAVVKYGGILLRGFPVNDPYQFDHIVGGMHQGSNGTGIYLGTAPRKKVPGTDFVSWASEISGSATIPVHLELCYTANPPMRLYFFAEQPNKPPGGQTPLADFREVWRKLPAALKATLQERGLMYERRYFSEDQRGFVDPLQHKSWQAMFQTTDRAQAEQMALAEGFTPTWEEGGGLLLTHTANISHKHEASGDEYWNTHFNVLHAGTVLAPLAFSAQLVEDVRAVLAYYALDWLLFVRNKVLGHPHGHDVVFADDSSAISFDLAMTIRQVIYKETWIFDWQRGDVLALDNHRIAHGRLPFYSADRRVYVAWH